MLTRGPVLLAGRGASVPHVAGSCARMGLRTVALAAEADPQTGHVAGADEVLPISHADPAVAYDSVDAVVRAATAVGATLVHPGVGTLAEKPELAARLAAAGIGYVGPPEPVIGVCQDKFAVIDEAARLGVPVLPHATGAAGIRRLMAEHGYPLIVKPGRGGMGEGHRVLTGPSDPPPPLDRGSWYAERFVADAVVVGLTVAVDDTGVVRGLGERETLLCAGSRKLVDVSPVCSVPPDLLGRMRRDAVRLAAVLGLRNVATVEFLCWPDGYSLMEVNGRLTGAYRMSEAQTGLDVIRLQLELACGRRFGPEELVDRTRPVAEARLYSRPEADPADEIVELRLPGERAGVAVDCTLWPGRPAPLDRLLVNVLATAADRESALALACATAVDTRLDGIPHHGAEIAHWRARAEPPAGAVPTRGPS